MAGHGRAVQCLEERRLLSAVAIPIGTETRVNAFTGDNQLYSGIATDSAGNYVVTWASAGQDGDSFGVFAKRYNSAGVLQGSVIPVNLTTTGSQTVPVIAMDGAGDFVISWTSIGSGNSGVIMARLFNSSGVAVSSEMTVSASSATYTNAGVVHSRVAMDSTGDFVVAWDAKNTGNYDVYARRYNSSGTALGSQTTVNTTTTGDQGGNDGGIGLGMDAAGNFVVTWRSTVAASGPSDVDAQRFDAAGNRLGSEFRINSTTGQQIAAPRMAMDSSGDFVVAWNTYGLDGSDYGVYANRFSASGSPLGSEFRVNTRTTGYQYASSIAMDSSGEFVVTWNSLSQDGDQLGVYAQLYSASGSPQGAEFRVNATTTGSQGHGRVAMDPAGDFVVSWQSYGQNGAGSLYDVYTQRYQIQPNVAPRGTSKTVSTLDNSSYVFSPSDFGFDDSSDPSPNNFLAVRVTSLPGTGTLTDLGVAVVATQFISVSDVGSGALIFTPSAPGAASTAFTFQVEDDGGTAFGGSNLDPTARTMTVNIIASDIAPSLTGMEGTLLSYSGATPVVVTSMTAASDIDSPNLTGATIQISSGYQSGSDSLQFTNTSNISMAWNGSTGTLTLSGTDTVANYQAALRSVSFLNTGTNTSPRSVSFQVTDGQLFSNTVSRVVDTAPTALSLVTAGPNPTAGPSVQFTLTFSEGVTGVDPTDIALVTGGWVAATTVVVTPVSSSVYTVTVSGITGTGTLGVNLLNNGSIADVNSNPLVGICLGQVFSIGTTPSIVTQPLGLTVPAGAGASFTAVATGTPNPTVQWQLSTDGGSTWGNVVGATSTTYSFVTAASDNGNLYRAIFTNAVGVTITTSATLTVVAAPVTSVYWVGLGDGHSWNNAANWSTHAVPGATDNVLISAAPGTLIHGPSTATTVNSLTITSANFMVDGAILTVTNAVVVASGQSLTVGNYTSLIPGSISLNNATLTLQDNGTVKGGVITETGSANIGIVRTGILDGATVNGTITITRASGDYLILRHTVTLNGTMLIGATDGSTSNILYVGDGTSTAATVAGNATLVFGGNASNGINLYVNGGTVTLAPSTTVRGKNGNISDGFSTGTILLQGTISADVSGGTIASNASSVTFQNSGTLAASNGATLKLAGTWRNTGMVNPAGTGTVLIVGSVDNSGATVNIDGTLTLQNNGTVKGGTINEDSSGKLGVITAGILDGVTVNGNINLTRASGDYLILRNTVTLNGTLSIGAADGSNYGALYVGDGSSNAATLAGNATVVFGGSTSNSINIYVNGGTATIGSTVMVRGKSGRLVDGFSSGTVFIQCAISADVSGGTITSGSYTVTFQYSGVLQSLNGGTLVLVGNRVFI